MDWKGLPTSLLITIFISFTLIFLPQATCGSTQGTIERTTKQQLLASIPPTTEASPTPGGPVLFLTSPSGKFEAYLLRQATAPGAGGFGNDFCHIQVQESGRSVWESECAPISTANTCSLLFSDAGLEVFDGSRSAWDAGLDGGALETLVLVDSGDMQIRDKDGELAWRASESPLVNQECGSIGSPGLASAHAPFAHPIEDRTVFGQPDATPQQPLGSGQQQAALGFGQQQAALGSGQLQPLGYQQNQPSSGVNQPLGGGNQLPLIDNTPFDSRSSMELVSKWRLAVALTLALVAYACF